MKIDILRPRYRSLPLVAQEAFEDMVAHTRAQGHDVRVLKANGSAMVQRARNLALVRVRSDADYVLFCDDDMAPEPDALARMLGHGVPVVSALCTTRTIPPTLAVKAYDEAADAFAPIVDIKFNRLVTGKLGLGAAFLLVQKPVLDQVVEYHLSGRDWLDLNRKQLDRLHVRSENREKERSRIETLRRGYWENEKLCKVFAFTVQDNEVERGEDMHFSRLLIQLGIPLAVDTGCQVLHIGEFGYGPYLLGVGDRKELRI